MAVNLDEILLPLGKARRELIPRAPSGKPISPATLWRWINKGLQTPSGQKVKLSVVQVGGRPYLSREALERFFEALTDARCNSPVADKRSESVERRLSEAGLSSPS